MKIRPTDSNTIFHLYLATIGSYLGGEILFIRDLNLLEELTLKVMRLCEVIGGHFITMIEKNITQNKETCLLSVDDLSIRPNMIHVIGKYRNTHKFTHNIICSS